MAAPSMTTDTPEALPDETVDAAGRDLQRFDLLDRLLLVPFLPNTYLV